jgi:two-component system, OmpR family, alkaline phosphatase synthesis response regulator PhoP
MAITQRILMVYNPRSVDRSAAARLEEAGFMVLRVYTETAARQAVDGERPDLIVLDMRLPGQEGLELVRWVRQDRSWAHIPLMMLATQADDYDKLFGLDLGADDYLTQPFGLGEMVARVRAILRRTAANWGAPTGLQSGGLSLDLEHPGLQVRGQARDLTPTEFALLKTLMGNPGHAFTRNELIEKALGYTYDGVDRTLDSHIKNLRKKVEVDPSQPGCLETVFGVGYRFRPDGR